MSRFQVSAKSEKHEVFVGWDRPLGTFFAQVYDRTVECEDDDGYMPLWRGAAPGDVIRDPIELAAVLDQYAVLDEQIMTRLSDDRRREADLSGEASS